MAPLPDPPTALEPVPFRVRSVRDENYDTFTLDLEPPEGEFRFRPGQFTMLYQFGIGEVPISISGDPDRPSHLIQTIRGVGSVTRALRELRAGDVVGVRGPFGMPWPVEDAEGRDVVFVAGGIGLAPLRSAVYHCLNYRDRYERVVLLLGARSPQDIIFEEELREWGGRFDMDVLITVDNADRSWHGAVGVVTKLIGRSPFDPAAATAFVCGPEVMMRFTGKELEDRGVRRNQVFVTMERNMKCGIGLCGHCQFERYFVCTGGPVFCYSAVADALWIREV